METRANYAIIGIFTLLVIASGFGFVWWFSKSDSGKDSTTYKVEFAGSVAGLSKGAPVLFNGIRVGDVNNVYFDETQPEKAFATIDVQPKTPIKEDTRANLDVALLSGSAVISLSGGSAGSPPLGKKPDQDFPTLVAERGGIASLLETARGTADRASNLLDNINKVVAGNSESINRSIRNVEGFSEALGRNAPGLDRLLASVSTAADRIGPVAQKLEVLTDETTGLIRSVDRQRVSRIVENVEGLSQTIAENRDQVANILKDTSSLVRRLNDVAPRLEQTLGEASRIAAAIDSAKVGRVIDNTDKFAAAIGNSSKDVEATLRNANSLTDKLNRAADRVDGVLKAAEGFLGSAAGQEGKDTFTAVRQAAEAFRKASENLDRRATEIAAGVTRLSGVGSRQVEGLGTDARRAVNEVGRAARNLERNPQSIIFGGRPSLPEYSGR